MRAAGDEREIGPAEAVFVAARHGRSGELGRLLEAGIAPTWTDRNGSTPLHQACMAGHVGCVQMLLDFHASIDAADEHGVTPLMLAAMANRADGVQALLSAGSSLDASAEGGLARMGFWLTILQGTALQIAERAGNAECVALLRGTNSKQQQRQRQSFLTESFPRVREAAKAAIQPALNAVKDALKACEAESKKDATETDARRDGESLQAAVEAADAAIKRARELSVPSASAEQQLERLRKKGRPAMLVAAERALEKAALLGSKKAFEKALQRGESARVAASVLNRLFEMAGKAQGARDMLRKALKDDLTSVDDLRKALRVAQSVGLTDSSVEKAKKDLMRLEERPLVAASTASELQMAIDHAASTALSLPPEALERARSRFRGLEAEEARAAARKERCAELGFAEVDVPKEFICPITQDKMRDPVVASDGNSYERAAIEYVLSTTKASPLTREALEQKIFVNNNLRNRIMQFDADMLSVAEQVTARYKAASASAAPPPPRKPKAVERSSASGRGDALPELAPPDLPLQIVQMDDQTLEAVLCGTQMSDEEAARLREYMHQRSGAATSAGVAASVKTRAEKRRLPADASVGSVRRARVS